MSCHAPFPRISVNPKLNFPIQCSTPRRLDTSSLRNRTASTKKRPSLLPNKFKFSLAAKPPKSQLQTVIPFSLYNSKPAASLPSTPLRKSITSLSSSTPVPASPSVIREPIKNPFQILRRLSGSHSHIDTTITSSPVVSKSISTLQRNCTPLRTPIQRRGVKRRCSTIFGSLQLVSLDDDKSIEEVCFDRLPPTAPKKRLTLPSCGLDMPLRTSSLSSENLDSNANFNTTLHSSSGLSNGNPSLHGNSSASNSTAGVLMRHEGRRGSLSSNSNAANNLTGSTNNGCHQRPARPATVSYELSDDIRDKEIALTERRYGGRLCSQRSARIIQSTYREYRMRREYARIRSDKRTSRRLDRDSMQRSASLLGNAADVVLELNEGSKSSGARGNLQRQSSVEDLMLEQAYLDWDKSSAGPSSSGSQTPKRSSTGSKTCVDGTPVGHHITLSRDSGVDAEECQSSPSGPSASNSTSSMNSAHSEGTTPTPGGPGGTLTPVSVSSTSVSTATPPPISPNQLARITHVRKTSTPARVTPNLTHQDSPQPPITPTCKSAARSTNTISTTSSEATTMKPASRRCNHSNVSQPGQQFSNVCCHSNQDKRRKRTYRIGLNIFNKSAMKGIDLLIKYNFIDSSPGAIARFLISRKGLSRIAIGEFLGNMKSDFARNVTRQFMREIDLRNKEVDVALRHMMSYFQTPGESQKIAHILEEFNLAYVEQNLIRASAQFRNTDSIMVLCYAIIMLHTDMYNPNVRQSCKMTREDFVKNLRGTDDDEDMDQNLLLAIYDRVQAQEMKALTDHTDQVRRIEDHLTGQPKPNNLVQPHRRLVCYCRLFEVQDIQKKERPGSHQRDVFLFNDMMLITKTSQKKKKEGNVYQCRNFFSLLGVQVFLFESQYYPFGIQVKKLLDGQVLVTLNTKSSLDRERFIEDLQECVLEVSEMDRLRIEEELAKQQRPPSSEAQNIAHQTTGIPAKHGSFSGAVSTQQYPPPHQNNTHHPSLSRSNSRGSTTSSTSSGVSHHHNQHHHSAPPLPPHQYNNQVAYQHCCQHHHGYPHVKHQYYTVPSTPQSSHHPRTSGDSGLVMDMDARML